MYVFPNPLFGSKSALLFGSKGANHEGDHRRWTLNERKVCVECRHASDAMPESCPSCKATTFVFIGSNQNADSVCDELLMVAALNRIGLHKSPPQTPHVNRNCPAADKKRLRAVSQPLPDFEGLRREFDRSDSKLRQREHVDSRCGREEVQAPGLYREFRHLRIVTRHDGHVLFSAGGISNGAYGNVASENRLPEFCTRFSIEH